MQETDSVMLIKTKAGNNNNKFYELKLYPDGAIVARYGRVGTLGQTKKYSGGKVKFNKLLGSKLKPENSSGKGGYTRAKVLEANGSSAVVQTNDLGALARKQIKYSNCVDTEKLIRKLVRWNVHNITSSTTMKVNVSSGQIELPSGMGILTQEAIDDARDILRQIDGMKGRRKKASKKWMGLVDSYLMLVPQVLPSKRGWIDSIYSTPEEIGGQESLLDSLESTLSTISPTSNIQKVFDLELTKIDDKNTLNKIRKMYKKTCQSRHTSSRLDVRTAYGVSIGYMQSRFESCKIPNVMELWHGTESSNLLSILKSGLIIPKHASNGRLYGNGVYFSDQSTKALNYASGYWSGGRSDNCFMFLADVRMGNAYTPTGHGSRYRGRGSYPVSGYDSTFAEGGKSGVLNNEMIVYNLSQVNLKYLVEFA